MRKRDFMIGGAMAIGAGAFASGRGRAAEGYHAPAEDEPHARTFMQWPVSRLVYDDRRFLEMTQAAIARVANAIAAFEPVTMLADAADHARVRRLLSEDVELWNVPTEDLWCRDSGPIFVRNDKGDLAVSHIRFNGWGEKQVHLRDGLIAGRVAERLSLPLLDAGLFGEAGGVEQDGHGLLIAHESSWVIENRNPGLSRDEVETRLLGAYGADRMIWSPGLAGYDITDYHIDALVRLTGPGRALINLPKRPDAGDPFHRAAGRTHQALIDAGLEIETIPEPVRRRVKDPEFVASYANFYVCNGAVIASEFGDDETDEIAHDALARHFPGREIVMLNVDALGELGGGVHCATHEMPA